VAIVVIFITIGQEASVCGFDGFERFHAGLHVDRQLYSSEAGESEITSALRGSQDQDVFVVACVSPVAAAFYVSTYEVQRDRLNGSALRESQATDESLEVVGRNFTWKVLLYHMMAAASSWICLQVRSKLVGRRPWA
jgi:hypothetical protein